MIYTREKYGNAISLTAAMPDDEKAYTLKRDKDRVIEAALRIRKAPEEVQTIDGFTADINTGVWTIDISATRTWHRRFKALLKNPEPTLRKWAEEDAERIRRATNHEEYNNTKDAVAGHTEPSTAG